MLKINVSAEQWAFKGNALDNRNFLNNFLQSLIALELNNYNNCEKTIITLPMSTTKQERYNIHRMSISNQITSESHGNDNNRVIEITLSKDYVQQLFIDYNFENIIPQKSDKQIIFDNLINFIDTNFNNEFQEYLSNL